jgi:hypothetical protein
MGIPLKAHNPDDERIIVDFYNPTPVLQFSGI